MFYAYEHPKRGWCVGWTDALGEPRHLCRAASQMVAVATASDMNAYRYGS